MIPISLKKWNSNPQNTYNFKIVTKLTDLGSPDAFKTLLGFYLNINKKSHYTNASVSSIMLSISYRESTGDEWHGLTTITAGNNITGTALIEEIFSTPIKKLKHIQIKIEGGFVKGNITINDFGLFYRKYRGSGVSDLNE